MKWRFALVIVIGVATAGWGCGGDEEERRLFTQFSATSEAKSMDWVVHGMSCDGEEVTRFVALVEGDEESLNVAYQRGDGCVQQGDFFWRENPERDGEEVSILVDSETDERASFYARRGGQYKLSLEAVSGDEQFIMRQAYEEISPTARPSIEDLDLGGQWMMEGFPCIDETVPQLIHVIHPPGDSIHMNKVVGDACVSDGVAFFDGDLTGTNISGEPRLLDDAGFGEWSGDEQEFENFELVASGTVRTAHFIRLQVLDEAVTLRRIMADAPQP